MYVLEYFSLGLWSSLLLRLLYPRSRFWVHKFYTGGNAALSLIVHSDVDMSLDSNMIMGQEFGGGVCTYFPKSHTSSKGEFHVQDPNWNRHSVFQIIRFFVYLDEIYDHDQKPYAFICSFENDHQILYQFTSFVRLLIIYIYLLYLCQFCFCNHT